MDAVTLNLACPFLSCPFQKSRKKKERKSLAYYNLTDDRVQDLYGARE